VANARLQKLGSYLSPHRRDIGLGILALFVVNAVGVYIPLLIRDSIDDLRSAFSFDLVQQVVWLMIALASVMWVIRMTSRILIFGVGRQVEFDLFTPTENGKSGCHN
jgi:ATP-binding cassette subfamily B protein